MPTTYSPSQLAVLETPLWFCLKAQPKREHLAAKGLGRELKIECYAPRLSFRKLTRRGPVWFVDAVFPGYLFAHFTYSQQHRRVEHWPGIQHIVRFGSHVPTVDPAIIAGFRETAGPDEIITITPEAEVGQTVRVVQGPLQGLEAVVVRLLPAKERIRVLLGFLGRSIEMEMPAPDALSVPSAHLKRGFWQSR